MPAGLPVALVMLAPAAAATAVNPAATVAAPPAPANPVYGPIPAAAPKPPAPVKTAERKCAPPITDSKELEIVVCAQRPQGYRLDPDVLAARRMKKQGEAGRPHNPHEAYRDNSCRTVGPMGCRGGPTINLLAAAATAAKMGDRLSKGQEIGSMFQTEPTPSEYQLYLEAKHEREAKEAEKAAKAKAAADAAKAASPGPAAAAKPELTPAH
jgi:hypothetical protein